MLHCAVLPCTHRARESAHAGPARPCGIRYKALCMEERIHIEELCPRTNMEVGAVGRQIRLSLICPQ